MDERMRRNSIKRILKSFPQYKLVDNIDNADITIVYNADVAGKFNVLILDQDSRNVIKNINDEKIIFFFLRHRNERNRRNIVINNVDKKYFMLHG